MRQITTIAGFSSVLFIGLAGWSSTATGARHRQAKCPNSVTAIVIADAQIEVYEAPGQGANEGLVVAYGCAYAQGRSYRLGVVEGENCVGSETGGCGGIKLVTLAGSVVAYTEGTGSSSESINRIVVRNLRGGRILHRVPTGTRVHPRRGYVGSGLARALVVKSDGAVAWIAENDELTVEEATYYEVHRIDRAGSQVLASGNDINPFSLALSSNTYRGAPPEVYWSQGGKAFSTPLN
jgi:hypothetical protein